MRRDPTTIYDPSRGIDFCQAALFALRDSFIGLDPHGIVGTGRDIGVDRNCHSGEVKVYGCESFFNRLLDHARSYFKGKRVRTRSRVERLLKVVCSVIRDVTGDTFVFDGS